jgi:uncharacterized integral membrane protein
MTVPTSGEYQAPKQGRDISPRLIAAGILIVLGLIFIFENTRRTRVRFLIPEVSSPLWLALLITFVLGGLAGYFVSRRRSHK